MRRWYGNFETIVNLERDAFEIKSCVKNYRLREKKLLYARSINLDRGVYW